MILLIVHYLIHNKLFAFLILYAQGLNVCLHLLFDKLPPLYFFF